MAPNTARIYSLRPWAVAALLAAAGSLASAQSIKIAVAGPMSGPVAQFGDMVKAGVLTALERINAAGGAGGRPLELVFLDDACEPKQAVAVANKVVSDGIGFVVGHACSGSSIPASVIYENEGIVMVTPSATAPQLTAGKPKQMIFRTIGRDDQQGPVAAQYIVQKIKPKKVAVLHDKQSFGQGIATAVKKDLDAAKIPVVLFEGLSKGDSDYSALVTKLKSQGVDFVYFGGYHAEMGLLVRQAREQGVKARFMGPDGAGNRDITAIAGASAEGLLFTLPADFMADPANAALRKAFTDAQRDPNGPYQIAAYAALQIIADAITGARSSEPRKVAAYMHQNAFETPIGRVEYDAKGDLKTFKFVVFNWHQDGSKTLAP